MSSAGASAARSRTSQRTQRDPGPARPRRRPLLRLPQITRGDPEDARRYHGTSLPQLPTEVGARVKRLLTGFALAWLAAFFAPEVSTNEGTSNEDDARILHLVTARSRIELWWIRRWVP